MDENFKIIYEILKKLEKGMDVSEFDNSVLSYTSLEISKPKGGKHKICSDPRMGTLYFYG